MLNQRLIDILDRWKESGFIVPASEIAERVKETVRLDEIMQKEKQCLIY